MATTTPGQGFPVPTGTDDPDIPDDMMKLALAVERRVIGVYSNATERDTKISGPQEGQVAFTRDNNAFTYFDGAAWQAMFPAQVKISSGASVPANTVGVDGDVFFKI